MTRATRRTRRLAAAAAGIAAACALALPAAAQASAGDYTPNPHQWYFSSWNIQQEVWPVTQGAGVTVAVIDSGVQARLPDLQGAVVSGGDMVTGSGNGEQDYAPNGGHGTLMAELIAGQGTGSSQFGNAPVGIAPQAKILPVHAIYPSTNDPAPVAESIKYAADHGADVINLSLGGTVASPTSCDPSLQQAVGYALARNVVVVAASGDANKSGPGPTEPASCAGVLAVGGVEPDGSLWPDSVQGPNVSVAGPGDQIYVTSDTGEQSSIASSGTSGASALVAGAAALIRSKYPSMPWYTVDQRLIGTAVATGPVPSNGTGYGIININKALDVSQYPVSSAAPDPPYATYQAWLKSTGQTAPATASSSHGAGVLIAIVVAVIVVLLIAAAVIIAVARSRARRG